jgi:hypothetical protein
MNQGLEEKLKAEIEKAEMNQGRFSVEFRDRTKMFASSAIRLFVKLPREREEVRVLGKQLLRSGTSVAAQAWPVKWNALCLRSTIRGGWAVLHRLHWRFTRAPSEAQRWQGCVNAR